MVPVVSSAKELKLIVPRIVAAVKEELDKAGVDVRITQQYHYYYVCLLCFIPHGNFNF